MNKCEFLKSVVLKTKSFKALILLSLLICCFVFSLKGNYEELHITSTSEIPPVQKINVLPPQNVKSDLQEESKETEIDSKETIENNGEFECSNDLY